MCSMGQTHNGGPSPGSPKVEAVLPGHQSHAMFCSPLLSSSRDDIIGKVCITRDMLAEHPKGRAECLWGPRRAPSPTLWTSWS